MEEKPKILIVHNYYKIPGGEDIVVENEKRLLEKRGHQVVFYCRKNKELESFSFIRKLLLPLTAFFSIRTYREVKCLIKKEDIDIVHVHNTLTLVSPSVYYAAFACGKPVLQTLHNFRLLCPNGIFLRNGNVCEDCLEKGLICAVRYGCYRNSRMQSLVSAFVLKLHRLLGTYKRIYYICLTEFNKKKLLLLNKDKKIIISEEHIFIKPNFIPDFLEGSCQKKEQYIYVGRMETLKGIQILLEAWRMFPEKKLLLCGNGPEEEWVCQYIKTHHMKQVKFLGWQSHDKVLCMIAESKALILPTMCYEGQPTVIMESYAVGTPVITTDIGNAGNMVKHGVTGFKFACGDVTALREAVQQMEKRQSWDTESVYESLYTEEKNYKVLQNIYESIQRKGR